MQTKRECTQLLDYLSEYLDDELEDEPLCAEIEAHLESCDNCRVVVDTLKKTISLYRSSAEHTELPERVRKRLYHRLDLSEFQNRGR
jgi:predicted anti-sigma-YlaC factor YlaD